MVSAVISCRKRPLGISINSSLGAVVSTTLKETYYLVGWINGADYGCEGDYTNMGEYKFVNGKLTATFTKDSYSYTAFSDDNGAAVEYVCPDCGRRYEYTGVALKEKNE